MKCPLVLAALFVSACSPTPQQQAQPQVPAVTAPPPVTTTPPGTTPPVPAGSGDATAKPPASAGAGLDVVIFLALDVAPTGLADTARAGVQRMLTEAAKHGADTQVALVAGKKDRGDAAFAPAAKAVDFDLAPKDALLAAAVAGCDPAASNFPDPHLAGNAPKVCGKDLLGMAGNTRESLTHTWLWSLNPVRGTLTGFFRKGARRLYVFVANGDAQAFDAAAFKLVVGEQGAAKTTVLAIVPAGACGIEEAAAVIYPTLAGAKADFCTATADQMGAAFGEALTQAAP